MSQVDAILAHYGVPGMKWGRRKSEGGLTGPTEVVVKAVPGRKIVTTGGKLNPASDDALKVAKVKQKARSSTTDSLSNAELKDLVTRMNLEQQYKDLSSRSPKSPAKKFVAELLLGVGKQQATKAANDAASRRIAEAMKKRSS